MNFSIPFPHDLHWQEHSKKSGTQVLWADVKDSPYKAIRGLTQVPHSITLCLEIIRNGDRLQEWVDGCCLSAQYETLNDAQFIAQLIYSVPWPLKNIISTELNTLTWNEEKTSVQLHYQSATPQHHSEKQHLKKCQPMQHTIGVWVINRIDDKNCLITHTGFANPGGKIPAALLNSSALSGQESSFIQLRKTLAN